MPRRETYDLRVESSGLGECGGVGSRQTALTDSPSDQWGKWHPCGVVQGGQSRCKAGEEAALWPAGGEGSVSATTGRQTLRRPPDGARAVRAGLHVGITSIHVVAAEKLGSRMPSLFLAAPSFPGAHSRSGCAGGGDEEFTGCLLGGEHFQVFLMQERG